MSNKVYVKHVFADNNETWTYEINIKSYDVRSHRSTPVNIASRFLVMEVYDVTGGTVVSASTNCDSSAIACAVSGYALLEFPLSSTSGIAEGLYDYSVYLADITVLASATYKKKIIEGPFHVE